MSMSQTPDAPSPAPSDVLTPLSPAEGGGRLRGGNAARRVLVLMFAAAVTSGTAGLRPGSGLSGGLWLALYAAGFLPGFWLPLLVVRLSSRRVGLAPVLTTVGVGHWGGSTVRHGRLVVFRQVPLLPPVWLLALTEPAVPLGRLRAATAAGSLLSAVSAAALLACGGPAAVAGWGAAWAVMMTLATSIIMPGSFVAMLFRPPSGGAAGLAELRHGPAELAAVRALAAGRLTAAREALSEPCAEPGASRSLAEATLALAEGDVEEAARGALRVYRQSRRTERRAGAVRVHAQALAEGIAAGRWTAEQAGPALDAAVAALRTIHPKLLRVSELPATLATLNGRTHDAVALATRAAAIAPDALSRARVLAVRAEVLAAAGDGDEARRALTQARRLAPGLTRTALAARTVAPEGTS
ncbi:hypothetical protein [Actinacidiphila acidipaludis]|uniref:Tetratricopeptide repeat protein n=1 Tax=Actinacidiphila acidipaludis TaxID=2873382 RepID=A0ABS7Q3Q0_9ACTN|nr:hypothetical protein [Streptomyces acidipaludis]MBY8877065.1 hypothetical protein [Streptomyces acidipaludis]